MEKKTSLKYFHKNNNFATNLRGIFLRLIDLQEKVLTNKKVDHFEIDKALPIEMLRRISVASILHLRRGDKIGPVFILSAESENFVAVIDLGYGEYIIPYPEITMIEIVEYK